MRNPMNSHDKSDSEYQPANFCDHDFIIGEADLELAKKLILSGDEHGKLTRMIHVQTDLTIPRFLWSELDTYHFNVKNSQSTMHKLLNNSKPISKEQFEYNLADDDLWSAIVARLEEMRMKYRSQNATPEEKKALLLRAKQLLPEGFLQMRTWDTNYQELRRIYFQRRNHRLPHWHEICDWISELPFAAEFITCERNK